MKFPLDSKKKYQLKKRLMPIKKDVMQLANPKILIKNKRKLLKKTTSWIWCVYSFSFICYSCIVIYDKMSRNIFYASNVQTDLFPNNTRIKFDQYIDINDLNYIKDDIEVGISKILFDNKQSYLISPDINKPHFMLEQTILAQSLGNQFMGTMNVDDGEQGKIVKWGDGGYGEGLFNIESSNDYIFVNQCRSSELMIVHFHKDRYFSNVMIVTTSNTIIHHIYMHQKECFYLDTFINHINKVLKNVTFYNNKNKQHTITSDLVNKKTYITWIECGTVHS